ncbi:hypothetical protein ACHHYP_03526 [Achlya hypogyna]|uniref:B box-type domain-containing protein n=1 Tax=Achlya hypogyna TaxID=1202772 RepID=A0A1V9Z3F2_ACHHY|nr:hypothetical protein ACHHYP_03526 [Achlya hypogyna]
MDNSPSVSLSRLRLFLAPHAAPARDGASLDTGAHAEIDSERSDSPRKEAMSAPDSGSVATVSSLNPMTKEFQRVRYLLQASLPGYRVADDDLMIWDMKNPTLSTEYEAATAGLLELDSWVAVEDLGPAISQVYSYGFTSLDSHHAMKFTTGNIALDLPGKKGKRQYVLCKIATGRSLVVDDEAAARHPLPSGYHSYYVAPKKAPSGYYHEYVLNNTAQVLPQYLVRFGYQVVDPTNQRMCALCERSTASISCRTCAAELCASCDETSHSANKLMGRHKRTPVASGGSAKYLGDNAILPAVHCRLHETKAVEFYCPLCAVPVCVNCKMVGDHSCGEKGGHRLISIADAYEQSLRESSKADPLIESRKLLIATKLGHIHDRAADVLRNKASVQALLQSTMETALAKLEEEARAKLSVLRCEELELQRQVQHIEWTDAFLMAQRKSLAPVEFLTAWTQHKPLRVEQRDFPVAHAPLYESVKADLQLVGRLQVVAGDDVVEVDAPRIEAVGVNSVLSPKGKKIIEDVRNDLLKAAAHSPIKVEPIKPTAFGNFSATLRGISVNQRKLSNPHVSVRNDVWSTKLRQEMGIPPPPPPMTMDEEEVIRQRLLTRSSVLGSKHSVKRTAQSLLQFLEDTGSLDVHYGRFSGAAVTKKPRVDSKKLQVDLEDFLWDLELVEADTVKCELLMHTCSQELKAYASLHADIDKSILGVTADIERLKDVVANEKLIRSYKEEYEARAREVNQMPSKEESATTIESLEEQLRQTTEALTSVTDRIDLRAKDFALLMRAIRDLQAIHKEDSTADEPEDLEEIERDEADDYEREAKESRHTAASPGVATPPPSTADEDDEPQNED